MAIRDAFGPVMFCTNCGSQAKAKTTYRGSIVIELLLWILFIIPGLIYTLWRITSKYKACPYCGTPNMIGLNSPIAQRALSGQNYDPEPKVIHYAEEG